MASQDGPWQNRARVFVQYTDPVVNPSSTSVTIALDGWLQMDGSASSNGTYPWAYSGDWGSGSGSTFHNLGPSGQINLFNESETFTLTDSWQYPSIYWWADHYAANLGTTGRSEGSFTIAVPPRYAVTPSSVTVTRISDTEHRVDWTRGSTYSSAIVQRSTDNATWFTVGTPAGNANTFTDTTTAANQRYYYRVAGVGGSGQSGWSATSAAVYTTPAPVTSVTAAKSGSNITVDVTGLPPYATSYTVQASQNGGAYANLQTGVTSFPWTHTSPNASVTWTYRVVSVRGALSSAASAVSNTVQLLAPPNAPTGLTPNGVKALAGTVRLAWVHNPVDTTAQTAYQLRYRLVGAGGWTTVTGTTAQYRDVSLTANVTAYEWQVQTKGQHASYGAWSAVATVNVISQPGVAINTPPSAVSWASPDLTVVWTFTQAQSNPQSAWELELIDSTTATVVEQRNGSGATTSLTLTTKLVDGGDYEVRVRAAAGEVWSGWVSSYFDVAFIPPAAPVVAGVWDDLAGTVSLTVTEGGGGVTADLVSVDRSVDGGVSWESWIVASPLAGTSAFQDTQSLSYGSTLYRVAVADSSTGAAATLTYEVVADSGAVWLSGGPGFAVIARLPFDPVPSIEPGLVRSVEQYDGRSRPVAYAGEQVSRTVQVTGTLFDSDHEPSADVNQLTVLAQHPSPVHLIRTPEPWRIYGVLSSVPMPRKNPVGVWGYSFTLTETDH